MSQNEINYGIDPSGAYLLDNMLAKDQQNRLTMDGGNSRPSYAMEGTVWTDKSVAGKATLKRFNGTSDNVIMTIDTTTGELVVPNIADNNLSNLSVSGKAYVAIKGYNNATVYSENEVVLTIDSNNSVKLYKSLADNNTAALSDTTKWEEVSFTSGAANTDLSNLSVTGNDKFVTKDTAQNVTANKVFKAGLVVDDNITAGTTSGIAFGVSGTVQTYLAFVSGYGMSIVDSSYNLSSLRVATEPYNANNDHAANTWWCRNYVGKINILAAQNVTSSVYAASGLGWQATSNGYLSTQGYNNGTNCYLYVYKSDGTLVWAWLLNITGNAACGSTTTIPVSPGYYYRIYPFTQTPTIVFLPMIA